jgi:hypothetical protein
MKRGNISFRERWIWYHLVGWCLGYVLMLCLAPLFEDSGWNMGKLPMGLAMALGLCLMEWAQLRKYGVGAAWMGYTLAGFFLCFFLFDFVQVSFFPHAPDGAMVIPTVAGALLSGWLHTTLVWKKLTLSSRDWPWWYALGWFFASGVAWCASLVRYANLPRPWFAVCSIAMTIAAGPILGWCTARKAEWLSGAKDARATRDFEDLI